jgi:hypothetical protein
MTSEWQFLNPPKCRKCGHTICPTVWACTNPQCPKNQPKPKAGPQQPQPITTQEPADATQ